MQRNRREDPASSARPQSPCLRKGGSSASPLTHAGKTHLPGLVAGLTCALFAPPVLALAVRLADYRCRRGSRGRFGSRPPASTDEPRHRLAVLPTRISTDYCLPTTVYRLAFLPSTVYCLLSTPFQRRPLRVPYWPKDPAAQFRLKPPGIRPWLQARLRCVSPRMTPSPVGERT
jgi:hypothetical protein